LIDVQRFCFQQTVSTRAAAAGRYVKGWPTATGLHPDVTAQEAKLTGLAAAEKSLMFNVPKNMMFAGRKYHVRAVVAVSWNGVLQGNYGLDRTVRADYNTISSVVYEGNGGDPSEYAVPLANGADSVPVPGVFDSTQLKPHLTRTETLPRRQVKHDETNKIYALSDVRVDPDWRTDVKAPTHVWYCRDMVGEGGGGGGTVYKGLNDAVDTVQEL
jgi:hypothetical protein